MEGRPLLTPVLVALTVADDADGWRAAGFTVAGDATCRIGSVTIRLAGATAGRGILDWTLAGAESLPDLLDGVATRAGVSDPGPGAAHPNGAQVIDHVVMTTPNPERTIAAIEATGVTHRRTRLPDNYNQPMRQDFFRLGEVILELIGPREPDPTHAHRPARLYGLAHTVTDLDATAALLGPLVTGPKDAVQPGRRIATLRTRDLGITVPTAFMAPSHDARRHDARRHDAPRQSAPE